MKRIILVCIGAIALAFASCSPSKTISVTDVKIRGEIDGIRANQYFKVKDGSYKFVVKGKLLSIKLPIETIKDLPSKPIDDIDKFRVVVFNKGGHSEHISHNDIDMVHKLLNSKAGDCNDLIFAIELDDASDILEQLAAKLEVEIVVDYDNTGDIAGVVTDASSNNTSNDSADWDAALDEYESYVDEYIVLYKKVKAGDMTAMANYTSMLEKAETFGEKFDNANGDMSSDQLNRHTKICTKLLNAL